MRAVVIPRAGGYDRLRLETRPDPVPGAGEVLIAVAAAGVNYADCVVRMGLYSSAREYVGWPITPGFEVAGTVAAAGAGVVDLAPGDLVYAVTRFGGYATHVVVPRHQAFAIPPSLSVQQAASFPVVFLTAWYALHELAHLHPGARVLVHSAAGGVGSALVQLAKRAGHQVVGVVGAAPKVAAARLAGADVVIDKSGEDLWAAARRHAPRGYDAVFDANGVATLRESYRHLGSPGKLVVYGFHSMLPREGGRPSWPKLAWDYVRTPRFDPLALTKENRSVLGFNLSYLFEQRELLARGLADLEAALAAGALRPLAVTCYPLARVAEAHQALESGRTTGKLVLELHDGA